MNEIANYIYIVYVFFVDALISVYVVVPNKASHGGWTEITIEMTEVHIQWVFILEPDFTLLLFSLGFFSPGLFILQYLYRTFILSWLSL